MVGSDVTALLRGWRAGDAAAGDALLPLVYDELRRVASRCLRDERPGHTFRPTDLVSEAYLRMIGGAQPDWNDRVHFFAIAANTMRKVLVDHARRRRADKRGGGVPTVPLDDQVIDVQRPDELVALDDALEALAAHDPRKARAVELNYFAGLSLDEVAVALDIHVNTVARDLQFAKAWIQRHIQGE